MKRILSSQRGHGTMLGAIASAIGVTSMDTLAAFGVSDKALAALAVDAQSGGMGGLRTPAQWHRAPFGTAKSGVKQNRRKAMKRKAVVRARKRGHA